MNLFDNMLLSLIAAFYTFAVFATLLIYAVQGAWAWLCNKIFKTDIKYWSQK